MECGTSTSRRKILARTIVDTRPEINYTEEQNHCPLSILKCNGSTLGQNRKLGSWKNPLRRLIHSHFNPKEEVTELTLGMVFF